MLLSDLKLEKKAVEIVAERKLFLSQNVNISSRVTLRDGKQATEKSMENRNIVRKIFWLST